MGARIRKGMQFEDQIVDLLSGYFAVEQNVELKGSDIGKRREIDIIAYRVIPPLGTITFLIECKSKKISKVEVDNFREKLTDIRMGGDPRANGVPIMISPEGFSKSAQDLAKRYGITLLSLEDLINSEIPQPPSVEKYINALFYLSIAVMAREEDIVEQGQKNH